MLFKGLLVLGVAGACWAGANIYEQSVSSSDVSASFFTRASIDSVDQWSPGYGVASAASDVASVAATASPKAVLYSEYPSAGEIIGSLSIPAMNRILPIIEGTDADDLKRGVGHFAQTALPGEEDNCVLSGHRDTVFVGLGSLQIGDQFIVKTSAGTFTYEIKRIWIVHQDDTTVIVPADHAVLTVTTCYPFDFIGSAPDRYILSADLTSSQ
ncbi:MAG: class D sortase [Coriobacteriia bacterium]|nr:class D sortase [Coriobacteriia bacterium]